MRFLILLCSLILSSVSHAQFYTGPISEGTGGAGRGAVDPSESSFLNPAAVAHLRRYYISGNYGVTNHLFEGEGQRFGLHFADGSPENLIPGAFSYTRKKFEVPNVNSSLFQDFAVTLSGVPVGGLAVGVTGHRLTSSVGGKDENQDNAHFGLLYVPTGQWGLGFVIYDFLPTSDSIPVNLRLVPTYALGFNYLLMDRFRFRLDLVRPDIQPQERRNNVMAGVESYFREDFLFRLGGQWRETADEMYVTGGLGYQGPRLSFDYTFQKDVRTAEGYRHLFDLWLPL